MVFNWFERQAEELPTSDRPHPRVDAGADAHPRADAGTDGWWD